MYDFIIFSEALEPFPEFEHHLEVVAEGLADAEAVAACGIDMERRGDIEQAQLFIVADGIDRGDDVVIMCQHDKRPWGGTADMLLVAVLVDELTLGLLA